MTTTYRYGIQQRPRKVFLADVSIPDPPPDVILHNSMEMAALHMFASSVALNMLQPITVPYVGAILFEISPTPRSMGYNMTQDNLDALVRMFNEGIVTSLPKKHGHK